MNASPLTSRESNQESRVGPGNRKPPKPLQRPDQSMNHPVLALVTLVLPELVVQDVRVVAADQPVVPGAAAQHVPACLVGATWADIW